VPTKARMHPAWPRALRDQCQAAGVPFFFKQWGEWQPTDAEDGELIGIDPDVAEHDCAFNTLTAERMARVGKKAAGRALDGRTWSEFPAP
jgi:protein gp37